MAIGTGAMSQELREAWDAGAYRELQLQMRVLSAGTAGTVELEHAAVNEEDAYTAISGTSTSLTSAANSFKTVTAFLRFIRWSVDGNPTGNPTRRCC